MILPGLEKRSQTNTGPIKNYNQSSTLNSISEFLNQSKTTIFSLIRFYNKTGAGKGEIGDNKRSKT